MINQHPQRSDEPVWWGLFGAGGTWFAMITPVTVLVLGILAPLGILDADALSYERVAGFAGSFIGGIIVILSLAMPMWHGMHRLYHGMHDLKIHVGPILKFLCYAIAFAITVLAVVFVFMV